MPTPEPAKRPIRWPFTKGNNVLVTAIPVLSRAPNARRFAASGGAQRKGRTRGPRNRGKPSSG
ncbi:hypothetical protein NBRC116593_17510 [Sulfitobacter pacificus]